MQIQGIHCVFNQKEWLQTLQSAFKTECVQQQKHAYVYLNQSGKCDIFFSYSEAVQKEFNCKLTIDDIICISQEHFKDYQQCPSDEIATLRYAFEIMDQGAQQSWWSRLMHWFRGLGFKNTHELIEEQLQLLADHDVRAKYDQLREKLEDFKQMTCQLNDERFNQTYQNFLANAQQWILTFEHIPPQTYLDWKKQEENLTNLELEIEQMAYLSKNISFLFKKKEQLNKLLQTLPEASIEKEEIKIEQSLNALTNQVFDRFSIHDEEEYQQKFNELDGLLEDLLSKLFDSEQQKEDSIEQGSDVLSTPQTSKDTPSFNQQKLDENEVDIFEMSTDD